MDKITQIEFSKRRANLKNYINKGAMIIPGNISYIRNHDVHFDFRQNSDFWYLTGFDEPNAVYDTNSFMKYEILFKKLFSIIKQIPDVSIIVKLHPSQQKNNLYLKKLIQKIDADIPIKQSTPIINEIQSCDVLINIFPELFPSTVLLEGLILKKPIMNISLYDRTYEFEFEKDKSVLSIKDSDDLEKNIKKLLFDKELQSRLIQNGTKHVNRYLSNPGNASEELARILNSY